MEKISVPKIFGNMVFNDEVMKNRLSKKAYLSLRQSVMEGKPLSKETADEIAQSMKEWAIEKGATHFTHWFQPMTGITAEKHDGFIKPTDGGKVIMAFSGKSLIKGESDASSLPSGGLRATFEARGYTAWDPTSYAFVKDDSLYIPTAFCSYGGEALDKKTPLLRSMDVINKSALKILRLFGNNKAKKVLPMVGAEQEYFLISKEVYEKRIDLIHCGRTIFGARPSKAQEMDDHYYGAIKSQVSEFMKDLDKTLWELGVYAKTKHNEAAPAQHELASFYSSANTATDQNQLTMEIMKTVANRHGLVCLLNEKPFAEVAGSGKHVNWSLQTNDGENLLEPGATPSENAQFLLFLAAVISGVDRYQDLLRISISSYGNDYRLGGKEAPPAIMSLYLGEELENILYSIVDNHEYSEKAKTQVKIGASALPIIFKDSTDRNRTSPFAFTGNKFEFRMVGSSSNIACPVFIINTIIASVLNEFYEVLSTATNFDSAVYDLIKNTVKEHKRILFSGNNYSEEWKKEALSRGLLEFRSTVDALPLYDSDKNVELFEKTHVLSKEEICSRKEILLENYANTAHIEALTACDIARKEITPAVISYQNFLLQEINDKRALSGNLNCELEQGLLDKLSSLSKLYNGRLNKLVVDADNFDKQIGNLEKARYSRDILLSDINDLREVADQMELIIGKRFYTIPTYEDILYSVKY